MYKLLGIYKKEWEKQTINLYFFQLWVSMLLEHQVWMICIVANFQKSCIILQSCSSFFFCLHGQPSAVSRGYLFSHFRVISSICFSVPEALFALSFSFLSKRFFFVHAKAALERSRNQ